MYYIGIDGSGVYARLVAVDENMKVIGKHTGHLADAAANKKTDAVKRDGLRKLISELNRMTNTVLNDCKALCYGSSAMDDPQKRREIENIFDELNFTFPYRLANEAELIISAHTRGGCGVVIYSGQISWGAAVDTNGKTHTCGGYGHIIDDGASAYSMGISAIKAAFLAADNRIGATTLTAKVLEHFKAKSISDVKKAVSKEPVDINNISELGLLVKYASAEGDNAALEIESQAAASLAQMANALIKTTGLAGPEICMAGGAFLTNENIRKIFTNAVTAKNKGAIAAPLKEKLEMGALHLAMAIDKKEVL